MTTAAATAPPSPVPTWRAIVGIAGVLLGAMVATLGTRVSTFALADVRGALGAGFDEGAPITTAIGVGQIVSGVTCVYLASLVGPRRLLVVGIATTFAANLLAPLSPNLHAYFAAQFLAGLGSGTFIPLTVAFILRNLPPPLTMYGVAVYALNVEFSLNVAASLEGFYTENWSWGWVHWQYCLVLPVMAACVLVGMPRDPPSPVRLRDVDTAGLVYVALALGCLYAALDNGNRLDWGSSGTVVALALAGSLAFAVFLLHEATNESPLLDLRLLWRRWLILLIALLIGFRFIILSTAYIVPTYLTVVQGFRGLETGPVLGWIALPQILIVLPLGYALTRIDPRWTLAVGTLAIALACLLAARITDQWAGAEFLPSQGLQAIGQSLALTSIVALIARRANPAEAVTVGAFIQFGRLFGGEVGVATMATFVRVREEIHSNLLGLHVDALAPETVARLAAYGHVLADRLAEGAREAAAVGLLARAVARQAAVLAYADGFRLAAAVALLCFVAAALTRGTPAR